MTLHGSLTKRYQTLYNDLEPREHHHVTCHMKADIIPPLLHRTARTSMKTSSDMPPQRAHAMSSHRTSCSTLKGHHHPFLQYTIMQTFSLIWIECVTNYPGNNLNKLSSIRLRQNVGLMSAQIYCVYLLTLHMCETDCDNLCTHPPCIIGSATGIFNILGSSEPTPSKFEIWLLLDSPMAYRLTHY